MARRKQFQPPRRAKQPINLQNVTGTSATVNTVALEQLAGSTGQSTTEATYGESVLVAPVARRGHQNIRERDFALTWKTVAAVGAFFLAVGGPAIWFAANTSSNIDGLQKDVKVIKDTTERLDRNAIRQDLRLDQLEKSLVNTQLRGSKR